MEWSNTQSARRRRAKHPGVSAFYFAVLPQFVSPGQAVLAKSLVMSAAHYLMGLVWLAALACVAGRARTLVLRPQIRVAFDSLAGFAMLAFGLKLAFSKARA